VLLLVLKFHKAYSYDFHVLIKLNILRKWLQNHAFGMGLESQNFTISQNKQQADNAVFPDPEGPSIAQI